MSDILKAALEAHGKAPAIVNDSQDYTYADTVPSQIIGTALQVQEQSSGRQSDEDYVREAQARIREERKPKTWFGEFTSGFGRGVDSLQETMYGAGALASDWVGFDTAKNFFVEKTLQQQEEAAQNPASVESYSEAEGFDKGMRYFLSQLGQGAPQIAESVATGVIGAAAGSAATPAGTVVGGLGGIVARKAVKDILKSGVDKLIKDEIKDFAAGKIKKELLSEGAEAILRQQTTNLAKRYGAQAAIAVNSIAQESGSIYSDLLQDPNVTESDRKVAATVGGIAAAIPDTIVGGWIASKFFPKMSVTRAQVDQATSYVKRFAQAYGKEILKVVPAEGGQEYIQTIIEEAAKNWADPTKRDAIFTFNEKQKEGFIDAALGGGITGLLGGGVAAVGEMRAHPNREVRTRERSIDQKFQDLSEGLEVDDDDRELEKIGELITATERSLADPATTDEQKTVLNETLTNLTNQENEIKTRLGIVNDSDMVEEPLPDIVEEPEPATPASRAVDELRSMVLGKMPTGQGEVVKAKPESVAAKSKEVDDLLNAILPDGTADEQRETLKTSLKEPGLMNMFASQGVRFVKASDAKNASAKEGDAFSVSVTPDGEIEFTIPDGEETADLVTKGFADLKKLVEHEAIHVADVVGQRDEYNASPELQKKFGSFYAYTADVDAVRSKALKDWWDGLSVKERAGFPTIARQLRKAYEPGTQGQATNSELSGEIPRMLVELTRTGKLFETTQALAVAEEVAKDPEAKGRISKFLREWINAIKDIQKTLARLFDFTTAPTEILKAQQQINEVLDKYGAISDRAIVDDSKETTDDNAPTEETQEEEETEDETEGDEGTGMGSQVTPTEIAAGLGIRYDGVTEMGEDQFHSFTDTTTIPGKAISITVEGVPTKEGVTTQMAEKVAQFQEAQPKPAVEEKKEEPPTKKRRQTRQTAYKRYRTALAAAKEDISKLPDAMVAHYNWRTRFDEVALADLAKEFKTIFGKGATLKAYREAVKQQGEPPTAKRAPSIPGEVFEDEEKRALGEANNFKFDGNMMERIDLYTDRDESQASFRGTMAIKVPYTKADLERRFAEFRAKFSSPQAKSAPGFSNTTRVRMERIEREVNNQTLKGLTSFDSNTPIVKPRQGELELDSVSPATLEYAVQRHTESAARAQLIISERGLWNVIGALQESQYGEGLEIEEDTDVNENPNNMGPNAILKALYELVLVQLDHINNEITGNYQFGNKDRAIVNDTIRQLEEQMRKIGTQAGQYNAFTGRMIQFWNAVKAKAAYIEPIIAHVSKIFKNNGKKQLDKLTKQLNEAMAQYMSGAMGKADMIAFFRKMQKQVHTRVWQNKVRQSIAKDQKKARRSTKKGAQRAAEFQAADDEGSDYLNKIIESILGDMTGVTKEMNSRDERQVLENVIKKIARETGQEMGLIGVPQRQKPTTIEQQFAVILKNDSLYSQFVNEMYAAYVREYGGEQPSEQFLEEADMLRARLANRWTPGMIDELVRQKMQQHNIRFTKIVQDHYGRGIFERQKIAAAIQAYMAEEGITDPALIDAIVNDIESSFDEQVNLAREKFFGSSRGVKDTLKNFQKTITELAKEHIAYGAAYEKNFAKYLMDEMGFPEDAANQLAGLLQKQLNNLLNGYTDGKGVYHQGEREKIINRWIKEANATPKDKQTLLRTTDRIIQLANMGVMGIEDTYRALQDKFNLPPYNPLVAAQIEEYGRQLAETTDERSKEMLLQTLTHYLEGQRGISTKDLYIAGLYVSMLSGPSTQIVNIAANATSTLGFLAVNSVKKPWNTGKMLRAVVRAATGVAQVEMREAWFSGMTLGRTGDKYFHGSRPLEQKNPVFTSKYKNPLMAKFDIGLAKFIHSLVRGLRGHYIGRALSAMDIFFYKVAQEVAYTAKVGGKAIGTQEMWSSALKQARTEVEGQQREDGSQRDPDTNRDDRRRMHLLAHGYYRNAIVNDSETNTEWQEAHSEALDATFQQDPKGWLGAIAKYADKWTSDRPLGKLIIPFTRVAANVTNHLLEWTPYGGLRWAFSEDFKVERVIDGEKVMVRDTNIGIRAILGTAMFFALLSRLAEEDEIDPEFTIYADGPRDLNAKRQLMERGWKPYTIKFGDTYFLYLYTPVGMAFSLLGRLMDDYREGEISKPTWYNVNLASTATAMLRLVTEQSFLAGASDIMSAVDSPDPIGKLSKFAARTSTTFFVPNLLKQIDRWANPTIQEANGFWEAFIKEIPIARNSLNNMLNVFGEDVKRTLGPYGFPGSERFITAEPGNDPVFNLLGDKRITVPGYSKSSTLHKEKMTEGQFYEYVQTSGPRVKKAISAELYRLRQMDRETAEKRIRDISEDIKFRVRREMEKKYPKS